MERFGASRGGAGARSIAVLPLENLSGDREQEYFADGMTDALIGDLARMPALRVISRTSVMTFKGVHRPLPEIAQRLGVRTIVEGSVLRVGNRLRIAVRLVDARTGHAAWSGSYEGELNEVLALQSQVAGAVAGEIDNSLRAVNRTRVSRDRRINLGAYDAYLKGRRQYRTDFTLDSVQKAIAYFYQALALDPAYAPAYAGLADCYYTASNVYYPPTEAMPKSKRAALKALELDDTLAEAQASLALVQSVYDFDRASAELERTQAELKLSQIELDRAKELRTKNTISASEFDQKAATYQGSSAAARSAEAAKNSAALNLEFTQIKSPIDGRVSDARITLGNLVQPGAGAESVLTTVVSVDPIYAKVDADENAILKYVKLSSEGKRVSARTAKIPAFIELGNETDFPHEGVVDFVDNRLDPGTGTVRARVVLKNWNPNLITPGFFVRVRVAGATPYRGVLIADKVITSQQGLKFAFVVKPDNTFERRTLETGPIFEGKRIVKNGLKDGEKVVSTRLQILQPGMQVTPVPESTPASGPDAKPSAAQPKNAR
jgi:RND family efflux transporter MFP subunit